MYAAGNIKNANGKLNVAKWNGTNWNEVGGNNTATPMTNGVMKIAIDGSKNIYAVGGFINTNAKWFVAKCDGISWSELGGTNISNFNN